MGTVVKKQALPILIDQDYYSADASHILCSICKEGYLHVQGAPRIHVKKEYDSYKGFDIRGETVVVQDLDCESGCHLQLVYETHKGYLMMAMVEGWENN